ncbi:MAG TPA: hypothetical protein VMB24_04810 [Dehalococcoidales bacterium]|nr:hypothetical protein [Dehalococcoidales bacterium]
MPAKKTAVAVKSSARSRASKGDCFYCDVCGLSLVVDEECGCVEAHEILCCGEPMKEKKARVKAK